MNPIDRMAIEHRLEHDFERFVVYLIPAKGPSKATRIVLDSGRPWMFLDEEWLGLFRDLYPGAVTFTMRDNDRLPFMGWTLARRLVKAEQDWLRSVLHG